jgi:hypothetical protein
MKRITGANGRPFSLYTLFQKNILLLIVVIPCKAELSISL